MAEENNNALSEEELDEIIKQNPQMGITEDSRKELTEQVTRPILEEAEKRMTEAVRGGKPAEPITRQEQLAEFSERQSEQKDKLLKKKAELVERQSKLESDFSQAGIALKENIQSEIEGVDKAIANVEKAVPPTPRPGAPTSDRIALPTTLPKHGIRALYSEGERILERASKVTNLPPESPATQAIAQRMAKGDPFSTEAMEDARQETMKLVKAGLIPNPNYEGWTGKVVQAYEFAAPLAVEMGLPVAQAITTAPFLVSPIPGSRILYFGALGQTGAISNLWAQQMRIGYGHQDETSWQEAFAAGGWSTVPGFGQVRKLGKTGKAIIGGFEAALMAGGENLTKQGLEIVYGKRDEISGTELGLTTAGGAVIGTVLNRIGSALDIKYDPKEKAYPLIRQALKENIRGVKKEVARLRKAGQTKDLDKYEAQISSLEDKLNNLAEPENKVLQRAIEVLEEQEQKQVEAFELFAKDWQESEAAKVLGKVDLGEPQVEGADVIPEAPQQPKGVDFAPLVTDKPFFIYQDGVRYGGRTGFGRRQLETFISEGRLKPNAKIAQIGDKEWFNLSELSKEAPGVEKVETGVPEALATKEDVERVGNVWNQLSQEEALFRKPTSSKETLEDVFADLEVEGWNLEKDASDFFYFVKTDKTGEIGVGFTENKVTVDSEAAGRGGDGVYQAALQFAHNTGRKYVPQTVLTDINEVRTISAMFSSALKNKSTKHFELHQKHRDYLKLSSKDMYFGRDYETDLKYLAQIEKDMVADRLSEIGIGIENLEYDFNTDKFYKVEGTGEQETRELLKDADIVELIKDADPYFEEGVGLTTFKRAVVTDTTMRGPRPGFRGEGRKQFDVRESLQKIFPAPTTAGDLDVRFTGPKKAGIAQEFKEKTLIEGVGQRMQTDNPVTAREALQELVDKTGGRLGQYQPVIDRLLALGKGTGIDAKLETRAAAGEVPEAKTGSFYESGKRRIVFDGDSSSFQQNPVYELLHESTHAVTVDNVNKYFDADSFNAIDINDVGARAAAIDKVLKKRLPKPVAEMFRMFKKADSMRDEIIAKGDLKTVAGEADTYWIKNPAEFMSMAFSDPVVQRALKGIEYDPKMSMWDKVVDTVKRLLGKGVTNDLADSIVTRVGEIAEMRLPTQRGRGTVDFAREILDDFKGGGGTRDVDPKTGKPMDTEDEIKARLLTDDTEKQRLINSVQDAIKEDLKNIKGGREGQLEYLAKVQRELDRRLGVDSGEEFALVLKASQLSDNLEVADALNELSIQMTANGAVMVKGFDDLLKVTREKDFNNPEELNDAMVSIHKMIPQMLGWKKTGTAAGRLLQSRKYTKDQLEVKIEQLETEMEENLVSSLKASKNMTPEELDKQIKTFGDIEAVKRLLKAVQQANDVSEVKDILIKQQQAFQNKSSLKKFLDDDTSIYTKVRDVGQDLLYSSMLSSPTTLIKIGLGNAVMGRYNSWMGKVGAKYMSVAPWARRGMSKEQFDEAYNFWSRVASSYGEFNDIALQGAKKAFKSGISDLRSHFERVGESALSMERTGLSGALGQSLENIGQFVDVPGKAIAAVDARSRMRIAHAMTKAKAEYDWRIAKLNGEEVPDNFDDYYKGFLNKVFTEDGLSLMTEDQVRRQAVLNAEKEGVLAENMASYIDNYVKNNWDTSTSNFVDYVQRNIKEVTFTDELGEFAEMNLLERPVKAFENALNTFPLFKTILNPFQRTGRNIIREGLGTTSALAEVPGLKKFSDKIWSKTVQDLNSNDPIVAARAKGRQIVGAGIIATAWGMAEAGLYEGMTAQNWKKRENIKTATGLNDYELRIPIGDGEYAGANIAALEPFATVLNIVADCHTLSKGSMAQKREAMSALNILALVVSNNIGNKSYFKNLGDALELITITSESEEAVEAKRMRLIKGMLGSGVPSIMNAASVTTDDFQRRSDDILKMLGKRIAGIAKEVPVNRDMWGEPIPLHKTDTAKALSLINPFKLGKQLMDVDDYVVQDADGLRRFDLKKFKSIDLKNEKEVRNAAWAVAVELDGEYHFNGGTSIKDGIDLQEIIHPETRIDAFERWQEIYKNQKIEGLTVQQATVVLARQLTTPTKLDPNQTPEGFKQEDKRLADFRKLLNGYKKVAYEKMRQEYPVLLAQEKESKIRNALLTISPNAEQLKRITSEMPVEEYKKTQPDTRLQERLKKTPYGPAVKLLEVID
jgi:hypothetical protein